tara:strand:+ start:4799 stop:5563 length:765 start_codon:yes stop_codon:yes gene_type:complete
LLKAKIEKQHNNFYIDIQGYEGPIDLLLTLARAQKVDLKEISIFELAEQYITFINHQVDLQIEVAADYLVMASWLAYLKSKLILPEIETLDQDEEYTAQEMASILAHRLRRLDAMKDVSRIIFNKPILNRDVFARGIPEEIDELTKFKYSTTLYDIIKSYIEKKYINDNEKLILNNLDFLSLDNAKNFLMKLYNKLTDWVLFHKLIDNKSLHQSRKSNLASTFSVLLDLIKDQKINIKQNRNFGEIYIKKIDTD